MRFDRLALSIAIATALSLLAAGCGDDKNESDRQTSIRKDQQVDPTPEDQSGAPSSEFETEDINRAQNADRLVELYCTGGSASEAQQVGCLSHVTIEVVCEQDTAAKTAAVDSYIAETGDETICD
jgi:hypothetical protein